jgi:two-component system, NarL family, response regulator LiaR
MKTFQHFYTKNKGVIAYGLGLALLLLFMKWLEYKFIIFNHSFEIYIGAIALLFTGLGIWLALKLSKPKVQTQVIEKFVYRQTDEEFVRNEKMIHALGLSKREMEIIALMALGQSNQEMADQLFVSLSTIKSHNQNIFEKLDVKRRIQAIEKARLLALIP